MTIRVSFSDIEKKDFSPMPPGVYPLVVTDAEESEKVGASGYNYVRWEFTVREGEYENRKLWVNISLSPGAAFKMLELLEAIGQELSEEEKKDFEYEPSDYIGAELLGTVKIVTYNGELRNELKSFHPESYDPRNVKKGTFGSPKPMLVAPGKPTIGGKKATIR